MHSTDTYYQIPTMPTPQLVELREHWEFCFNYKDRPRGFDYHGTCLIRATLELERRGYFDEPEQVQP